jgi:hypothetical protein
MHNAHRTGSSEVANTVDQEQGNAESTRGLPTVFCCGDMLDRGRYLVLSQQMPRR